ncbi:MAG TPA: DUF2934 domain-containing protein [Chthoniobacterales bacterium]|jgi:hypothetical protein
MAKTSKKSMGAPPDAASTAEPIDAAQNGSSEQNRENNDAPKAGAANAKPSRKRATSARKSTAAGSAPRKPSTRKKPAPAETAVSEDDIRLRAYYLAEQRIRDGLAGDSHADWLEARRQLLAEAAGRA